MHEIDEVEAELQENWLTSSHFSIRCSVHETHPLQSMKLRRISIESANFGAAIVEQQKKPSIYERSGQGVKQSSTQREPRHVQNKTLKKDFMAILPNQPQVIVNQIKNVPRFRCRLGFLNMSAVLHGCVGLLQKLWQNFSGSVD